MKHTAILILMFLVSNVKAQFVVVDPGHIVATIANGGFIKATKNTMEDINVVSNAIHNTVSDIRDLQQNIDLALWDVKSLLNSDDFAFGNINFELNAIDNLSLDMNSYVNGILPGEHEMLEGYNNGSVTLGGELLHDALDIDLTRQIPNSLEDLIIMEKEHGFNRSVFHLMTSKKAIQIALTYNQMAEVMTSKAEELNHLLKTSGIIEGEENALKMNESERIQLMETTASYVRKALDLRLMCDQLIRKEVEKRDPAVDHLTELYRKYLLLNKIHDL